MYNLLFSKEAEDFLKKLDKEIRLRIFKKNVKKDQSKTIS